MAYDPETHRLFIAWIANGSLEVVDLETGEHVQSIGGLARPEGVAVNSDAGIVIVACAGDGTVHGYDTQTLVQQASASGGESAGDVRLDRMGNAYVAFGGEQSAGGLLEFDARTLDLKRTMVLPLRPESFQVNPDATCLFANQPGPRRAVGDGAVAAIDAATGTVTALWRLHGIARNFAMVYEPTRHRVYIAGRLPPVLAEVDDRTGSVRAQAPCAPDCHDMFLDAAHHRIILIGGGTRSDEDGEPGEGAGAAVQVFSIAPSDGLTLAASIPTAPHARTGLFVPERSAVYVAVPPGADTPAEIREYTIGE